jgi:hypothetical protein
MDLKARIECLPFITSVGTLASSLTKKLCMSPQHVWHKGLFYWSYHILCKNTKAIIYAEQETVLIRCWYTLRGYALVISRLVILTICTQCNQVGTHTKDTLERLKRRAMNWYLIIGPNVVMLCSNVSFTHQVAQVSVKTIIAHPLPWSQ